MCLWFVIIASNIWTRRAIIVSQRHLKTYRHSWSFIFSPYSFEKMAQAPAPAINWVHVRRKETPNSFLLEHTDDDEDGCFCLPCRSALYLEQFMQNSPEQLHFYHELLGFLRVKRCRRVFKTTLQQIVNGKAYKQKCIGNLYAYWKPWAKKQPQFQNMPDEDLEAMSRFLGACSSVYDNWDTIVRNLTDPEISPDIDCSTFSVEYFRFAKDPKWCHQHNASVRRRSSKKGDWEVDMYEEELYKNILNHIINSGILLYLDHHGRYIANFGSRLTQGMLAHAKLMKTHWQYKTALFRATNILKEYTSFGCWRVLFRATISIQIG